MLCPPVTVVPWFWFCPGSILFFAWFLFTLWFRFCLKPFWRKPNPDSELHLKELVIWILIWTEIWIVIWILICFSVVAGDPDSDQTLRLPHWQRDWELPLEVSRERFYWLSWTMDSESGTVQRWFSWWIKTYNQIWVVGLEHLRIQQSFYLATETIFYIRGP